MVFACDGEPMGIDIPGPGGVPALLVAPVTDAVKRVDGDVVASFDRDTLWAVDAMALGREVLEALGDVELSAETLVDEVRALGYSWQIIPTSAL